MDEETATIDNRGSATGLTEYPPITARAGGRAMSQRGGDHRQRGRGNP